VITVEFRGLSGRAKPHGLTLSLEISRSMLCAPSQTLRRDVNELRTAAQLERRFSRRELFTIFANRVWFGAGQVGVEAASQHFFQKEPNQLQAGESALLAGLIRAPAYLSPFTHPDRALKRRNEVLDAMVEARAIDAAEGETAKASALGGVERSAQWRSAGLDWASGAESPSRPHARSSPAPGSRRAWVLHRRWQA
jgi:membrane peptidoglycan carboxypeptidase